MRILHVVPSYYPAVRYGGPIRSVHGLAAAQAARGHSVSVYTTSMDGPQDLDVPLATPVRMDGVAVSYFRVPAWRRLAWSPDLDAHLRRTVASYDILHLHSVYLLPTYYAARAAQRARVPYVAAPRGMLMRAAIGGRSRLVKRAWIRAVERRTYREAGAVHVTATLEAKELDLVGIRPRRLIVAANGLDLPARTGSLAGGPFAALPRPYALFLSRISWKKGLDRLIRAWGAVAGLNLVIAGNDDEGYQQQMQDLSAAHGLSDRVSFVGEASDADKWALYREAELFVLPSYAENFGNVVVEAMAMGCPVIVSHAVGAADLVAESGSGRVNSGEPAAIAADVNALHADPQTRAEMGDRGRAYVSAHLGWSAIAATVEDGYAAVLQAARQDADV